MITVPFDKATIKGAPKVGRDGDGNISQEQEAELYAYYAMSHGILGNGGGTLVGTSGDTLGTVAQVFLDDETGNPEWVTSTRA